ncbi:hypothetical protein OROHE_006413 [Orobanche hederae]
MASEENREAMPLAGKRADGSDRCDSEKDTDDESPANAEEVQDPGSHEGPQPPRRIPYEERLVCWTFKRKNLAQENHKVMVTGYESTIGDIRCCLESFGKQEIREMAKSAFGHYMKLPDIVTRSGKVKGKVLRFSRMEFVLISGLKFGPAKTNPYMMNDKIPADSVYARLLDSIPILPVNLRAKFIDKKFKVNKVEVKGSEADYVKLAKVLMASMYVVGLDPNKTKIPNWMWALVEDDEAWEQFPWGSLSYQFLIGQINAVKKFIPGPYHLKGNTVAFLAWIYEVIPSIGLKFGRRMDQEKRPRMLRYRYSTASDFLEYPSKELISALEPSDRELNTDYWKSLEEDPEKLPFAFQFDANHSKKKRKRNEDEDEEEVVPVGGGASTSTVNAQLLPPNLLVGPDREALIKEIGDYVGEIAAKRARMEVEALLRIHEEKLVGAVGEYVVRRLSEMERTPADVPQAIERQAWTSPRRAWRRRLRVGQMQTVLPFPPLRRSAAGQEMTKFDTMLDPSDTQINAIYDDLVYLAKVTPPAQGILPGAVPAAGAMQQPTFGKATGQEMLDPSDTQMNAIYDELVCLGKVTPPVQCIPQGAIGPREALEQPTTDKMIVMNDDITPPAQSIIPCAVGSSRHAPIMVAQLKTPTALAIPKVVLNVRPIRRRFPAAAIRSPFLHDDIRGGDTFHHYLRLEDGGVRNVGQPCGDKTFFEEIETPDKQLHIEHIESYVAILSTRPDLAGLKDVHTNIALASSYFMETVEEVFDVLHRGMRQEFQRYDHKLFDPTIEEEIPVEEMDKLCLFAEAVQPNWGENMKQWIECDKVVTICNYNDHWGIVLLDLKRQKIWLYDSMAWKFDYHHICNRRDVFLPMMRIVPQILKRIGYFDRHRVKSPQLAQWELCFPSPKKNSFNQIDSANCGLYALKYVEQLISKTKMPKSLKTDRELILYRDHIARSIYAHSTEEPTVPIPMELI